MGREESSTETLSDRRRPADRRDLIVAAAAVAFSRRGFHATTLAEIADAAGVSAPALYKHFSDKYSLFAETNQAMADLVDAGLAGVAPVPNDPRAELGEVLHAFAGLVAANRDRSDLFRRDSSVLKPADREAVSAVRRTQHRRARTLLSAARPELNRTDADTLVAAASTIAASPSTHRVPLARKSAVPLIGAAASNLLDVSLPAMTSQPGERTGLSPSGRRETVLGQAIRLFADRGFHEVTVDEIASAAKLPASGLYRHFSSKQEILSAALARASDRATTAIATGLASAQNPTEALAALAGEYARLCAADPAIISVYLGNLGVLDDRAYDALRRQQRRNVDEWATWLQQARPEIDSAPARFLVHAALNVMSDLSVGAHRTDPARVAALGTAVLWSPQPSAG